MNFSKRIKQIMFLCQESASNHMPRTVLLLLLSSSACSGAGAVCVFVPQLMPQYFCVCPIRRRRLSKPSLSSALACSTSLCAVIAVGFAFCVTFCVATRERWRRRRRRFLFLGPLALAASASATVSRCCWRPAAIKLMSRFYDAVDESLSLISARRPGVGWQAGSTSRQAVNLACASWSSLYNVCESFASTYPRQVLPAVRLRSLLDLFLVPLLVHPTPPPTPLSVLLNATRLVF